jgi:hypothetical protein
MKGEGGWRVVSIDNKPRGYRRVWDRDRIGARVSHGLILILCVLGCRGFR